MLKGADNRQERLLAAVIDDKIDLLNDPDFRYLQLLKKAWNVSVNELSPHLRKKKIELLLDFPAKRRVNQVIRDMTNIFGNIQESHREMERQIYIHRISRHLSKLERTDPGNALIGTLYKLLKEVQGLDYKEENIPWDEIFLPEATYSTDINDLPDAGEYIEHEEIEKGS